MFRGNWKIKQQRGAAIRGAEKFLGGRGKF